MPLGYVGVFSFNGIHWITVTEPKARYCGAKRLAPLANHMFQWNWRQRAKAKSRASNYANRGMTYDLVLFAVHSTFHSGTVCFW